MDIGEMTICNTDKTKQQDNQKPQLTQKKAVVAYSNYSGFGWKNYGKL